MQGETASQRDALEADIDLRMYDLMLQAGESFAEQDVELVFAYMRAAFGKGYTEALTEAEPGKLCRDNGYRIPRRCGEVGT